MLVFIFEHRKDWNKTEYRYKDQRNKRGNFRSNGRQKYDNTNNVQKCRKEK